MEVPIGFLEKLWSFVSFLPFFFLLLLLGLFKGMYLVSFILTLVHFSCYSRFSYVAISSETYAKFSLLFLICYCLHSPDCWSNLICYNFDWQFLCDHWPLAGTFHLDLLLLGEVLNSFIKFKNPFCLSVFPLTFLW